MTLIYLMKNSNQEAAWIINRRAKRVFNILNDHTKRQEGGLYNIDALGGSANTFLSDATLDWLQMMEEIAISQVLSGIAATLLQLGTTFHWHFGAPIPCAAQSCSNLKLNSNEALIIKNS